MADTLRLLVVGAHPDDAEFSAGGLAALYRRAGHEVKFVSVTCGDAGHHRQSGAVLARRRKAEAQAAAAVIGATAEVWDYPDGRLEATLAVRWDIVRAVRSYAPDLVLTHRSNDYHPDHRAVGQAVCDASYLVTVPALVPDTPILLRDPVVGFLPDRFTRPAPLAADVVVDVSQQVDAIVAMLACHVSQVFEWLPFNRGMAEQVPTDHAARQAWLKAWYTGFLGPQTERYRQELVAAFGPERGEAIEYAEVFEISEYGSPLDETARTRLFGFLS